MPPYRASAISSGLRVTRNRRTPQRQPRRQARRHRRLPAFRDIVRRIDSIKNTQKITKAMQVVAALRLRRGQAAVQATRPYADKMLEVLQTVSERATEYKHPFLIRREGERAVMILVTTDKGLAGARRPGAGGGFGGGGGPRPLGAAARGARARRRGAALLRAAAALVPRPVGARQRRLQPTAPGADRRPAGRRVARLGARRGGAPARGAADGVPVDRGGAGRAGVAGAGGLPAAVGGPLGARGWAAGGRAAAPGRGGARSRLRPRARAALPSAPSGLRAGGPRGDGGDAPHRRRRVVAGAPAARGGRALRG